MVPSQVAACQEMVDERLHLQRSRARRPALPDEGEVVPALGMAAGRVAETARDPQVVGPAPDRDAALLQRPARHDALGLEPDHHLAREMLGPRHRRVQDPGLGRHVVAPRGPRDGVVVVEIDIHRVEPHRARRRVVALEDLLAEDRARIGHDPVAGRGRAPVDRPGIGGRGHGAAMADADRLPAARVPDIGAQLGLHVRAVEVVRVLAAGAGLGKAEGGARPVLRRRAHERTGRGLVDRARLLTEGQDATDGRRGHEAREQAVFEMGRAARGPREGTAARSTRVGGGRRCPVHPESFSAGTAPRRR